MILRELQKQGIYVKSYANITRIGFAGTEIVDDSREVKFRIVSMTCLRFGKTNIQLNLWMN